MSRPNNRITDLDEPIMCDLETLDFHKSRSSAIIVPGTIRNRNHFGGMFDPSNVYRVCHLALARPVIHARHTARWPPLSQLHIAQRV